MTRYHIAAWMFFAAAVLDAIRGGQHFHDLVIMSLLALILAHLSVKEARHE